jgi:hypothetical protein
MIDTRVYYVIHTSAGAIVATGFCDRTVLKARAAALHSTHAMLEVDAAMWQRVRAGEPNAFSVSGGAVVPNS